MLDRVKKYGLWLLGIFVAIVASFNLIEVNDAGEILVIQGLDGGLKVVYEPGPTWQGLGSVTRYKRSSQIYFLAPEDKSLYGTEEDNSLPVKFNDGGHARISGSMRLDMPLNPTKKKKSFANSTFLNPID